MTYAALCAVAVVVARLPRAAVDRLGPLLGWVAGSLLRVRRGPVLAAMARAGVRDARRSARTMYRDLGRGLVELLRLAGADGDERRALVSCVSFHDGTVRALDDALARGPVVLFASHTGNWEVAAAAAARLLRARGRHLAVVAKPIRARGIDALTSRIRSSLGVRVISPKGALSSARRAAARGHVIAMPIDQVPDRASHGSPCPFLGRAAFVDRAPATLAYRLGATVLVVASYRDGDRHHVRALGVIRPPSRADDARTWIEATSRTATSLLDAFVRRRPEAWLWLHRRWKTPPARLVAQEQAG